MGLMTVLLCTNLTLKGLRNDCIRSFVLGPLRAVLIDCREESASRGPAVGPRFKAVASHLLIVQGGSSSYSL
ncbi:hypothetical protein J6590_034138 [Homalodisca vitripennis]|nr:hypothetical protein J6590_034138 [Homalodisca vitripennis]